MEKEKILVVDDDGAIRKYLKEAFILKGFDVITANNGVSGLESALKERPQLILLDVKMPEMDGLGMLKELRKSGDWGKKIPVMILSNFDTEDSSMQGIVENEPSFYFLKSEINPDTIIDKFREITKK